MSGELHTIESGLRSGEFKSMAAAAQRAQYYMASLDTDRGVRSGTVRELGSLAEAALDCLACTTEPALVGPLLSTLHTYIAKAGKAATRMLFRGDCIALAVKMLKQGTRDAAVATAALRLLSTLCLHEKKCILVLRLEGGLELSAEALTAATTVASLSSRDPAGTGGEATAPVAPGAADASSESVGSAPEDASDGTDDSASEPRALALAALAVIQQLIRKNSNNKIRLLSSHLGGLEALKAASKQFGDNTAFVAGIVPVLQLLASHAPAAASIAEAGFVKWLMLALSAHAKKLDDKSINALLRALKHIVSHQPAASCAEILKNGGFDIVWVAVRPALAATGRKVTIKLASALLGYLQRYVVGQQIAKGNETAPPQGLCAAVSEGASSLGEGWVPTTAAYDTKRACRLTPGLPIGAPQWTQLRALAASNTAATDIKFPSVLAGPNSPGNPWLAALSPELWDATSVPQTSRTSWNRASRTLLRSSKAFSIRRRVELPSGAPPGMTTMAGFAGVRHPECEALQSNPMGLGQSLRDMYMAFNRLRRRRASAASWQQAHKYVVYERPPDDIIVETPVDRGSGSASRPTTSISPKHARGSPGRAQASSTSPKKEAKTKAGTDRTDMKRPGTVDNSAFFRSDDGKADLPSLRFDSDFESGNLRRAIRVGRAEYDLVLCADTNTNGYTQWFYFGISNMVKGVQYTFNIINNEKSDSAFNEGMRPVFYSLKDHKMSNKGWQRLGASSVSYFHNNHARPDGGARYSLDKSQDSDGGSDSDDGPAEDGKGGSNGAPAVEPSAPPVQASQPAAADFSTRKKGCFYTLTMSFQFPHSYDNVRIAYSYPFTYSYHREFVSRIAMDPKKSQYMKRQPFCSTRGGNLCELITITDFQNLEGVAERPVVVLSSRVHPGEVNASWVTKGIIQYLTSEAKEAQILRRRLVFKIVPILNPDGVIHGNYRCNLSGVDLNRHWENPSAVKHPTTYAFKTYMHELAKQRPILLYTDFHGHSTMKNFCLYGCSEDNESGIKPVKQEDIPLVKPIVPSTGAAVVQAGEETSQGTASPSSAAAVFASGWKGKERIFPMILANRAPEYFLFGGCKFSVVKKKRGSARVVFWRELRLWNCFTMEGSFCGSSQGPLRGRHYATTDYEAMGALFCRAVHDWVSPDQTSVVRAIQNVTKLLAVSSGGSGSGTRRKKGMVNVRIKKRGQVKGGLKRSASRRNMQG